MNTKFISECKELGIIHLSTESQRQKAILVAKKYGIAENDVIKIIHEYFEDEKQKQIAAEKDAKRKAEEEAIRIKEDKYRQDALVQQQMIKPYPYIGREKRINHLREELKRYSGTASYLRGEISKTDKMADIVFSSANIEKKTDWATMGGIASGIAGPAAGVVVASQIIAENEKIEARNKQNLEYAFNLSETVRSTSRSNRNALKSIEEQIESIHKKIEEAQLYLVDERNTDEVFEMLSINVNSVTEKLLQVSIKSKNKIKIFDDVDAVVDGTLWAHIYQEKEYVGSVRIILPFKGVTAAWSKIDTSTSLGIQSNLETVVEFEPEKLWLIEKV